MTKWTQPPMGCEINVRAMPSTCPVAFPELPHEIEILDWFLRVRQWGLERKQFLSKGCIIAWMKSLLPVDDELDFAEEVIERLADDDPA
jgi:hypothetical protein